MPNNGMYCHFDRREKSFQSDDIVEFFINHRCTQINTDIKRKYEILHCPTCHLDEGEIFDTISFKIPRRSYLTSLGMTSYAVSCFEGSKKSVCICVHLWLKIKKQ